MTVCVDVHLELTNLALLRTRNFVLVTFGSSPFDFIQCNI